MKLFVSGATRTVHQLAAAGYDDVLGCFRVPGETPNTVPDGMEWFMDNGCFTGLKPAAIKRLLWHCSERMHTDNPPHFITVPDVVGDWASTYVTFMDFRQICLDQYGTWPWHMAVVLQEGINQNEDLWFADAIFVGGLTDEFKLKHCEPLMQQAHEEGKWVHVGRINGKRKIKYLRDMGCVDSFDGTGYSRWPDANLIPAVKYLRELNEIAQRPTLFDKI